MKKFSKTKVRHFLVGKSFNDGFIGKMSVYLLLIIIGFIYLFPLIKMFAYSIKDLEDLVNPTVQWIPTKLYFENYRISFVVLNYGYTLLFSLLVTLVPALLQTITTSLVGYALAKFKIRLKVVVFGVILLTYLLPVQVYMIPRYVLFDNFGILETAWAIILPAIFGQGLSSAIFILIFYQFFRMQPKALDESAEIDGANAFQTFMKIGVPLAIPAYLTAFLFSFVWYWNETYISSLFIGSDLYTLQLKLFNFTSQFNMTQGLSQQALNEAIRYSATILIILPVLVVYIIMQKWFVEGIDRTGLTGE
ncbi:MAG: carbohydrate ABC transporter permease [Candidatus Izemoplasmatales bacterium]